MSGTNAVLSIMQQLGVHYVGAWKCNMLQWTAGALGWRTSTKEICSLTGSSSDGRNMEVTVHLCQLGLAVMKAKGNESLFLTLSH